MATSYSGTEKIVGLFIICITVLLLTTVVILGRGKDWFAEEVTFYTTFKESYNLQVNAAVKLFKADIGKVKQISLGEDNVNVKLAILAQYASRIRRDSVALVDSPTLIGSEYISIVPGTPSAPKIPAGGTIPSIEKKSISDVFKEFEVEKTAMLTVRMLQDLADLVTTMKDPQGPIVTTLTNLERTSIDLARITGRIERGEGALGSLVTSRELIDRVLLNIDKVNTVLDDIQSASAKGPIILDQVSDNLTTIQTAGSGVVENVQALKVILEDARSSLETIQIILDNLKQGSQDIPQVTVTAKEGIREIREGVEDIDRVVQSLQRNILIRSNLPNATISMDTDAGLRP
jgi:phospholipid/cholesterol/gamma-HCH transport system substrate-binding protein